MNIAQASSKARKTTKTTKIYINIYFDKLADAINNNTLLHQFNGKGRKLALIPQEQESDYFYYSADSAGLSKIEPPFVIDNGDNIRFRIQAAPGVKCRDFQWKGIIQNNNDLSLVSGTRSTYKAEIAEGPNRVDIDEVIINIHFKMNKVKFSANWDPRIRIGRGG